MGAIDFDVHSWGKDIREAYQNAVDEATHENGNDGYSGTINTTHGYTDVTNDYKRSGKTLNRYIQDVLEDAPKRSCYAICMQPPVENTNKVKSEVVHRVTPGTKKWELKYVVYADGSFKAAFSTKGEAVKFARKYVEGTQYTATVKMEKLLAAGDPIVATVRYKKSTKEKMGCWAFFGVAAC